jgi:predicted Zn-dependent protease
LKRWTLGVRCSSLATVVLLAGCIVNPVTGERDLGFVTPAQEIEVGRKQYVPAQQMQGGAYATDPALTRYVTDVGQKLASASGVALPYEFVVLDNSVPNAWALPGGKLAINRGLLLELDNEAELAAVLGHEVTHAAARHGAQAMERGMLLQGALLAAAIGASGTDYGGAVVGAAQVAGGLVTQKFGRDAEREADHYGTLWMKRAGYDPAAAISLQETFVRLSADRRENWLTGLFASHPPSKERVENNRALVASIGAGGDLGEARYKQALAGLERKRPAFAAYDEGRAALAKGDAATALAKADAAIELAGDEASFHGLRGEARYRQKRFEDAIVNYDRAIARHEDFFAYHLGRGLSHMELGQRQAARTDLERSVALLPTAPAYNGLGRIAEADGQVDTAMRYYQAAAQSDTSSGRAARARYVTLDLPRRPGEYVRTRVTLLDGQPVLEVANAAGIGLVDVRLAAELLWADGRRERVDRRLDRLAPGESRVIALPRRGTLSDARAAVLGASPAP